MNNVTNFTTNKQKLWPIKKKKQQKNKNKTKTKKTGGILLYITTRETL